VAHGYVRQKVSCALKSIREPYKVTSDDKYTTIDALFRDLTQKSGETGVMLRGLRYKKD